MNEPGRYDWCGTAGFLSQPGFGATNICVLVIQAFVNEFNKGLVTQASWRQFKKTLSKQNIDSGELDVSLEFFYRVEYFIVLAMAAYLALVFQKSYVS